MKTGKREAYDRLFRSLFRTTGLLVIAVLAGILAMLLWNTVAFFLKVKPWDFIIAAVMLGVGRAIGETMTVLMATGNVAAFPKGFFDSVKTITATIAIEMGEVPYQTTHYFALFAIATVLFIITLLVNIAGEYFVNRFRKYQEA